MRKTKVFTSAIAALALTYAAGCCETQYRYGCPGAPAPAATVTYKPGAVPCMPCQVAVVECPPAHVVPVVTEKPKRAPSRWRMRSDCRPKVKPVDPCDPCGTATVVAPVVVSEPQVVVLEPAKTEVAGTTVTVLQRGRKGRIVCYKEGTKAKKTVAAPVVATAPAPVYVASEPYTVVPEPVAATEPAADQFPVGSVIVGEPVAVMEPAPEPEPVAVVAPEPVVEEPSWVKYLAPDQPATIAVNDPFEAYAEPVVEPAPIAPQYVEPYAPLPVAQAGQQPIVIQPIIQPVVQTGQEVLAGQVQAMTPPPVSIVPQYPMQSPLAVPMVAPGSAFDAGLVSSSYCPPEICPPANAIVCGPGQNMSECFTLSENQLLNGPQILTPNASTSLAMGLDMASAAPAAPAAPLAIPPAGGQDKYGALAPAPQVEQPREVRRPEVSMPAPIGGTTTPPVAGTSEIESALDAMLGNTSPMLK